MGTNGGRFERRRSRRKKEGSLKFVDKWDLVWAIKRGSTPEQEYTSFFALTPKAQHRFQDRLGPPLKCPCFATSRKLPKAVAKSTSYRHG